MRARLLEIRHTQAALPPEKVTPEMLESLKMTASEGYW